MADASSDRPADRLTARLAIVDGLVELLRDPAAVVHVVAASASRHEARETLMAPPWNLSEMVAAHALDLPFGRTTARARADLEAEAEELRQQIQALQEP